jgi:nitroreductase / dihydropteridine reductase
MKSMIDALQWRYATKVFDAHKKLSAEQVDLLLEAVRLSPSSFGLQMWKAIVVTNPEIRERLRQAGYGQAQITDASHVIIFAVKKNLNNTTVDELIELTASERGVPASGLQGYADMMKQTLASRSEKERTEWASRQAYIALGVLLATAAHEEIDACPMEGFDVNAFDEILGLKEKNLTTCVVATVGFRAEEDKTAQLQKVRFPKGEVIQIVE